MARDYAKPFGQERPSRSFVAYAWWVGAFIVLFSVMVAGYQYYRLHHVSAEHHISTHAPSVWLKAHKAKTEVTKKPAEPTFEFYTLLPNTQILPDDKAEVEVAQR